MGWRARRTQRQWCENLLRDIRAVETTTGAGPGDGPDIPLAPLTRRDLRRHLRRARATRPRSRSHGTGKRRRSVVTVVATLLIVALLATVSVGPFSPAVRRVLGLGSHSGADGHASSFLDDDGSGGPVGFSPCRPIHYVVDHDDAPADSDALVGDWLAVVSRATGLRFIDDGSSHEDDYSTRRTALGGSAVPVLTGWSTTDRVVLDADTVAALDTSALGRRAEQAVSMHELGHLVGLGHVDETDESLYPVPATGSATAPAT